MGLFYSKLSSENAAPSKPLSESAVPSKPLSESAVPTITTLYLNIVSQPSIDLVQPSPKLIILDLNGTLVYRKKTRNIILRPFTDEFAKYLFTDDNNFFVMVWSTARPENVHLMVDTVFGDQKEKLIAIWGRDKFGFTEQEYNSHTKSIKNLDTVWNALNPQIASGNFFNNNTLEISSKLTFDATNTILIDDSRYKTQLQPYNAIHPREFDRECVRNDGDSELKKIIEYLEVIKYQSNIASYMKENPFSIESDGEAIV
jgi:hypothetical protein